MEAGATSGSIHRWQAAAVRPFRAPRPARASPLLLPRRSSDRRRSDPVVALPYSSERTPSVSSYDTFGRRRLDTGNIALDSLELGGSTLSWAMDGVAYSATLD
jgi:hypothetical protein